MFDKQYGTVRPTGVKRRRWIMLFAAALCLLPGIFHSGGRADEPPGAVVRAVRVAEVINPTVADFITQQLEEANDFGAGAFLLELDTPGGLDTAMRSIIQALLGSDIPVIVYVYPQGARAASAGALITLAADFAVMAPGTNLGAAHPVAIGGEDQGDSVMMSKVLEDAVAYARSIAQKRGRNVDWAERMVRESLSIPADEALQKGVIDLLAENETDLLANLDGRTYRRGDREPVLQSRNA
jgi:membrane-bound serine protease (ClpP class)